MREIEKENITKKEYNVDTKDFYEWKMEMMETINNLPSVPSRFSFICYGDGRGFLAVETTNKETK